MSFVDVKIEQICNNVTIHIIDIQEFTSDFAKFIDEKLITIYLGTREIILYY